MFADKAVSRHKTAHEAKAYMRHPANGGGGGDQYRRCAVEDDPGRAEGGDVPMGSSWTDWEAADGGGAEREQDTGFDQGGDTRSSAGVPALAWGLM